MLFGRLFDGGARRRRLAVENLYGEVLALARDPWLYGDPAQGGGGVPDTLDGRFEMMVWHLALVVRNLRGQGAEAKAFSQDLFDHFIADMEKGLRESGVGDIVIPKRLQKMVRVWFGRIRALEPFETRLPEPVDLSPILARNLAPDVEPAPEFVALSKLLAARWRQAEEAEVSDLLAGRSPFETGEMAA